MLQRSGSQFVALKPISSELGLSKGPGIGRRGILPLVWWASPVHGPHQDGDIWQ